MSLIERIPAMSDQEVVNFLTNARRLAEEGSEMQQSAAAELLPALEVEAETRKVARLESAAAKRAATRKLAKAAEA